MPNQDRWALVALGMPIWDIWVLRDFVGFDEHSKMS